MKLDELLQVIPEDAEFRAARARRVALMRLDEVPTVRRRFWKPLLVMAALCLLAFVLIPGRSPQVTEEKAVEERTRPLRVQMILGDGTRVEWTFNENFRL